MLRLRCTGSSPRLPSESKKPGELCNCSGTDGMPKGGGGLLAVEGGAVAILDLGRGAQRSSGNAGAATGQKQRDRTAFRTSAGKLPLRCHVRLVAPCLGAPQQTGEDWRCRGISCPALRKTVGGLSAWPACTGRRSGHTRGGSARGARASLRRSTGVMGDGTPCPPKTLPETSVKGTRAALPISPLALRLLAASAERERSVRAAAADWQCRRLCRTRARSGAARRHRQRLQARAGR